jgi:outer membrane protein, adhesin transport system
MIILANRWIGAVVLGMLSGPLIAQPATAAGNETFQVIGRRVLEAHPDVQGRKLSALAQQQASNAAGAARLPRIDFNSAAGRENSQRLDGTGNSQPVSGTQARATLIGRVPLFDGTEITSETLRQSRLGNARIFELRQAEDTVLTELARAWFDVIRTRHLVAVARQNIAAHERLVALVQQRVSAGAGRGVDLDQARARLSSARLSLASDEGALAEALARFQRFALSAAPSEMQGLRLSPEDLPSHEREVWQRALVQSPGLRASAENTAASDAEVQVRRSAFAPRVALEARHDLSARTAALRDSSSSSVLLTFNYNLFAGGGDRARQDDATLRSQAARQQFQDAAQALRQTVSSTWAEAQRQLAVYEQAAAYAESIFKTRDVYRQQFDIGQRSLLDLLNTENELAQAQRLHINSWADAQVAQVRLLALTGRVAESFGITRNEVSYLLQPAADPINVQSFGAELPNNATPLRLLPIRPAIIAQAPAPTPTPAAPAIAPRPSPPTPTVVESAPVIIVRPAPAAAPSPAPPVQPQASAPTPAADPLAELSTSLPSAMTRSLRAWRDSVNSGIPAAIENAYSIDGSVSATQWWPPAGQRVPSSPARLQLLRADQIASDSGSANAPIQLNLLSRLNDSAGPKCLRSTQLWRMQQRGAEQHWHIVRERTISVPLTNCP